MADLLELATRVEQATGPDRELDFEMATAIKRRDFPTWTGQVRAKQAKHYTASLEAALTLVPAGARFVIDSDGCHCRVTKRNDRKWPFDGFTGFAATMPLALTAAALRARASTCNGGGNG